MPLGVDTQTHIYTDTETDMRTKASIVCSWFKKQLSLPGIVPGTLSVLDSRDNHYTTETTDNYAAFIVILKWTTPHWGSGGGSKMATTYSSGKTFTITVQKEH